MIYFRGGDTMIDLDNILFKIFSLSQVYSDEEVAEAVTEDINDAILVIMALVDEKYFDEIKSIAKRMVVDYLKDINEFVEMGWE